MHTDILIIGGGASGLAAAIAAKQADRSLSVTVCEKNDRVGKKLLATGNGRCNFTNRSDDPEHFHGSIDAAGLINETVPAEEFFSDMGMLSAADPQERVYPYSNSAPTVLNTLRAAVSSLGAEEICSFNVTDYRKKGNCWEVISEGGKTITAKCIIIATGGYAAPVYGTDGSVIRLLREKGYKIAKLSPAVAPLRVAPESVKGLKGVRARCTVTAVANGEKLRTEEGELQFTENSLSGICVFNLAYLYAEHQDDLWISADFAPDMDIENIRDYLNRISEIRPTADITALTAGMFSKNLAAFLVKTALKRPLTDSIMDIDKRETGKLAHTIKDCHFYITGASSWQNAQSTLGGVHADEVSKDLSSRRERGVYFCGEVLDTAGDCGGFNLKWAWASGIIAGKSAAVSLKGAER